MSEKTKTNLKDAIFEVMETMFFLCPSVMDSEESPAWDLMNKIGVKIESTGNLNFKLWLMFTEELLRIIASSLFSREPNEFEKEELLDLAREAANMIGGAYLNVADPTRTDSLSLPEILDDIGAFEETEVKYYLEVEEEPMIAFMQIKDANE